MGAAKWAEDLEMAARRLTVTDPAAAGVAATRARALRMAPPGADGWAWLAASGDLVAIDVVAARALRAAR